jgi:hypothetical protein
MTFPLCIGTSSPDLRARGWGGWERYAGRDQAVHIARGRGRSSHSLTKSDTNGEIIFVGSSTLTHRVFENLPNLNHAYLRLRHQYPCWVWAYFPSHMGAQTTSRICDWCMPTATARFTAPVRLLGYVDGLSCVRGNGSARFCGGGVMAPLSRDPTRSGEERAIIPSPGDPPS